MTKRLLKNALFIATGVVITLLAQFGFPAIGLLLYGNDFRSAYLDCQISEASARDLNGLPLETDFRQRVLKTEQVDQLSCLDYRSLRYRLQALRVSSVRLSWIESDAVANFAKTKTRSSDHYLGVDQAALDQKLQTIAESYGIRPLGIRRYEADPEWKLGQALFFDPALSGNRDVSCATCHLLKYGLSDGLPRSIGANGEGVGAQRVLLKGVQVHPRHALDLWNRDNNAVSGFFWDGHVEVLDSAKRVFRSPLGNALPTGFQNAMAVQAVFPLAVPDEMLGYWGERSKATLPPPHAGKLNDLVVRSSYPSEVARILSVHGQLLDRLLARKSSPEEWQQEYRAMFRRAYPEKTYKQLSIVDLGNAIAHYEELAFASADSAWDRYIGGDMNLISKQAKIGAIVFYGKGRCAACHAGLLFSDFQYHGAGIFSKIYVDGKYVNDLGRGSVTGDVKDDYHFRTPPLRNVTRFGPYFHDGSTAALRDAIIRHLHPLAKSGSYNPDGSFAINKDQADSVSPILATGVELTDTEVRALVTFLGTLDSQSRSVDQIVPNRVPSGIPISHR